MSNDESQNNDDVARRVTSAFEDMAVPLAPPVRETVAWLVRERRRVDDAAMNISGASTTSVAPGRAGPFARLSRAQTLAVGGIGVSIAAGLAWLAVLLTASQPLSAMERMARELREVKSYSYKIVSRNSFVEEGQKNPTVVDEEGQTYWMAPDAFHNETKIDRTEGEGSKRATVLLEHFVEVNPAGKSGMFIDHKYSVYCRIPSEPIGSPTYPWDLLRMIRENAGEIIRELDNKEVQGKMARGYVVLLKDWHDKNPDNQVHDPVEVWVDPETNLPLEFGYEGKDDSEHMLRATNFRWNIPLDPHLFEPVPPEGYADITPPRGDEELHAITAALALYADVSGGHYPRQKKFDAAPIQAEMLQLAGFAGEPQPAWEQDEKFRKIQQARKGLDWIARILRNRYHAFYGGREIGPTDKYKLLLWWRVGGPDLTRYCVVYGDLRTERLTEAQAEKLGLSDAWPNDEVPDSEIPNSERANPETPNRDGQSTPQE
jgi:outer membrane lipoprotein-sorting protein